MTTTRSRDERAGRQIALRRMLEARRREVLNELQGQMREARRGSASREVLDEGELSDGEMQDDITAALLQMKSETLTLISGALRRLDAGTYGVCLDCGDEIAEVRVRALPFALRCRDCEEIHERQEQLRRTTTRRGAGTLFREASLVG